MCYVEPAESFLFDEDTNRAYSMFNGWMTHYYVVYTTLYIDIVHVHHVEQETSSEDVTYYIDLLLTYTQYNTRLNTKRNNSDS